MKKSYRIENIDCANCAEKLQNSLKKIEGVIELKINFLMQKLVLEADSENFSTVLENIKVQAKKIEPKVLLVARVSDIELSSYLFLQHLVSSAQR